MRFAGRTVNKSVARSSCLVKPILPLFRMGHAAESLAHDPTRPACDSSCLLLREGFTRAAIPACTHANLTYCMDMVAGGKRFTERRTHDRGRWFLITEIRTKWLVS